MWHKMKTLVGSGLGWMVAVLLAGCSDATHIESGGGAPGNEVAGSNASGSNASGGNTAGAATSGGGAAGSGNSAGSTAGDSQGLSVELPPGSREVDGTVNLVDAEAAAELETFLFDDSLKHASLRHGLNKSLNLFLEHYAEDYDFVFLITAAQLPNVPVAGMFEAVTSHAAPGGSQPIELAAPGYETTGRIKGVIGVPYVPNDYYPPFAHETLHYWAQYLDPSFGFGEMRGYSEGPHWGASSVNGQLGGFDPATLRCLTPAGAAPPACTALPSGRVRYVVGAFGGNANAFRNAPYSELELYLMGLLPDSGVPESFALLTDAEIDQSTYDDAAKTFQVEASGIQALPFSNIVARHGKRVLLEEAERHFKAAFVVISAQPAADDVMKDIARWSAVFGNRLQYSNWESFETVAGGLATMDTRLGPRRAVKSPPPAPREPQKCDVLAQNCPRPELSCYLFADSGFCAISQGVKAGDPCDSTFACAPGLYCVGSAKTPDNLRCEPYCDIGNTVPAASCSTLCTGEHVILTASDKPIVGLCLP
jgi:hypothetical protein